MYTSVNVLYTFQFIQYTRQCSCRFPAVCQYHILPTTYRVCCLQFLHVSPTFYTHVHFLITHSHVCFMFNYTMYVQCSFSQSEFNVPYQHLQTGLHFHSPYLLHLGDHLCAPQEAHLLALLVTYFLIFVELPALVL